MSSYVPAKKGVEFIFYVGLESVATAGAFQSNPTIASGDCKVSIDGGTLTNLATLPTVAPSSSKLVKITLSSSEMNGDNITVIWSDAAGGETKDLIINIQTAARQIDDLAYGTVSANVVQISGDVTAADNAESFFDGDGYAGTNNVIPTVTTVNGLASGAVTASALATDAAQEIADTVLARSRSNVDNTASEDSLYELIGAILDGDTSSGDLEIFKTDGTTVFNTRALGTNPSAIPITSISGA